MNEVEKFISENQHQLGYIMQESSRQWAELDKLGALTVGECNVFIEKYGKYHEILEKMQRYEKALKGIANSGEDSSCNELALEYEAIAEKALNY